jgi:hypothetical protein
MGKSLSGFLMPRASEKIEHMNISILGYELTITLQKRVVSSRIVCADCGQNTLVWSDVNVCEHCQEMQLSADRAEALMLDWADRANQRKG